MTGGYPGLRWRPGGERIDVHVLESLSLPAHWSRLDAFEGGDYRRIVAPVHGLGDEAVDANIYVVARDAGPL